MLGRGWEHQSNDGGSNQMDTVGRRVRARRLAFNLTQEDLAILSGVRLNAIAKLENDQTPNPHWLTMVGVAKALDLALDELAEVTEVDAA
jgi:transcriptional regulator with XRE-family HTH domain